MHDTMRGMWIAACFFALAALAFPSCGQGGGGGGGGGVAGGGGPQAVIPPRPAGAPTGSAFMAQTDVLSRTDREALVLQELLQGNVPGLLRSMAEVSFSAVAMDGATHIVTFYVMRDYLAIGSDSDFVRIPIWSPTAQAVADAYHCSLPTRRMVDLIWQGAAVKLAPVPLTPTAAMMSNGYFLTHNQRIEQQLAGVARDVLVGGDKKDVVISNLLLTNPTRVAIYGWHQLNGQPIQPLSTVHENTYADYSHGTRLVHETAIVDGALLRVVDILHDPVLHPLLSDEGVMPSPRIPTP